MPSYRLLTLSAVALLIFAQNSLADAYRLAVAPLMSPAETRERYTPLLQYLQRKTGHSFELVTSGNFMSYWSVIRKPKELHFALGGSHLAAYLVARQQHGFVARLDGVVSYSLIARADEFVIEPEELLNKRLAILPAPNMSALAAAQVFSNPMRQPVQVPVVNAEAAMEAVRNAQADAAFVPTPFLQRYPEAAVILTTDQMPGMTLTASPGVAQSVVTQLQQALFEATDDPQGKKALEELRFVKFIKAEPSEYAGLEKLLEGMWGY